MYRVLLVDDEPSITASMRKSIDWSGYQCTVTATATSGTQALAIIEKCPIDIVITDIRMQQMGGLELCQILYTQYPRIQIIVISGYAEFSYAQKAIKYGILGYCLKPIEYDELSSYLNHAVTRLQRASQHFDMDDLLNALSNEDISLLTTYLKETNHYYECYYCAVFSGSQPLNLTDNTGILIRLGKRQYGYLSHLPLTETEITAYLAQPENNCLGISNDPVLLKDIPFCMKNCQIKSQQYFIQSNCKICHDLPETECQTLLNQVASCLSAANSSQLLQIIDKIKNEPERHLFSVHTAMRLNNMICSSNLYYYQEDTYYLYSDQQMLDRYPTFLHMLDTLYQLILNPAPSFSENIQLTNTNFLKMIDFLNQNYTKDISTNDLAQYMHLNSGYLSKVFKKETGTTVTKYITNLRMLKSRQMLDSGNYSISEIASAVGYNDYFYFLKTFKKFTGMTPHQYQLSEGPVSSIH